MKTQQVTAPGRHDHPPQSNPPTQAVRRVGPLDRAAMHLGLALIRWGRRPTKVEPRQPTVNAETIEARQQMEQVRDSYQVMNMTRLR
ncbi:hypothetical protein [Salinibacterium sp. ZJ450]|uniref:hypothetical protein n=1 Tax=Salinibacterium sp. ZJ450 TaxID=2708338 RepID=UPI00141DD98F|nr:hypothetical protein [Salinibacterium sp. ZJ450]